MHQKIYVCTLKTGFRSVVVITFALHAKGPQFKTGRKQVEVFLIYMLKFATKSLLLRPVKAIVPRSCRQTAMPNEVCSVVCGMYRLSHCLQGRLRDGAIFEKAHAMDR